MDIGGKYITVDGHRFHHVWLRDNCPCPYCCDPSSQQKIHDPSEREAVPVRIERDAGALLVTWSDDSRPHRIPVGWLREAAYDDGPPQAAAARPRLWNRAAIVAGAPVMHDADTAIGKAWDELYEFGFTRVCNLKPDDLPAFVASIGPVSHFTKQEALQHVKIAHRGDDLAYTSHALSPHTDRSFMRAGQPMILVLYCAENTVKGGESLVVDGFQVAEDLRAERPEDFEILCNTPATFRHFDPAVRFIFKRHLPIIERSASGEIVWFTFSQKNFSVNLPFAQMERYYAAYTELLRRLKSPRYQFVFRLEPGQCLLTANFRVLHGRTAFDASSGVRHMIATSVCYDYFLARRAFAAWEKDAAARKAERVPAESLAGA